MGQLTQTTAQVQVILDDADAANVGKTSLTDGSDTTSVAFKKSGFYSLQGSSANAPSTDRAVLISAVRDTAATGEIRYGQIAITESNGLWWNRDDGGSLGTWYEAVTTASAQTLTNKTLTSPILTTPQINDSAADHQYIFAGSDLAADRTVTLPLLTGDDTFVFAAHTQTLTNKTLTTPTVSGLTLSDASIIFEGATANDHETTLTVTDPTADRTITLPDATDTLVGRATTDTLTNKTLTSPIASGLTLSDASIVFEGATADAHETTLTVTDPTADRTITLPNATDTLVGLATTDTLTNKTLTSPVLNTGVSGTAVLDEDDFTGASATKLATSESIKAYVDSQVGSFDTLSEVLAAGNTTGSNDIAVDTTQKVQFRDTAIYINSSADGQLDIVSDTTVQIDSGGTITLDADTDGQVAFKDGGTQYGLISKAVNNLILKSSVVDGDVIIQGTDSGGTVTAATFDMSNSGAATFGGAVTADAGISVDNITIDGTEIDLSSGDLTIDVAGNIILDADGGEVKFDDGGTRFANLYKSSNNFVVSSAISDGDIVFKGNDGGSTITALTLDMSSAGRANFNNDIGLNDGRALRLGSDDDGAIYNDGSNTYIKNATSNHDIIFQGNDDGSAITALTIDMSAAGAATFNSSVSTPTLSSPDGTAILTLSNTGEAQFNRGIVVNEGSYNSDFRVESDGATHMLFVDGGTNQVGINRSSFLNSTVRLEVGGADNVPLIAAEASGVRAGIGVSSSKVGFYHDATSVLTIDSTGKIETVTNGVIESASSAGTLTISGGSTNKGGQILLRGGNIDSDIIFKSQAFTATPQEVARIGPSEMVVNEGSLAYDFRVESDTNANMLFVDAGNDHVNIGTSSDLNGVLNVDGNLSLSGAGTSNRYVALLGETSAYAGTLMLQAGGGSAAYGAAVVMHGHSHATNPGMLYLAGSSGAGGKSVVIGRNGNSVTTASEMLTAYSNGAELVINEFGNDQDFRVESDSQANAFVVDGGNNSVTFGKATDGLTLAGGGFSNLQSGGHVYFHVTNTETDPNSGVMYINRQSSDGILVQFRQANSPEGTIEVSGATVSYNGFAGRHESSGIATTTAKGTVVSTIDELDEYLSGPRQGQTRADHAKVKMSDTVGDARVYGVVDNFTDEGKVNVISVGIGSIKVTGACAGGDLLESNGDGTAKVQADDIIRSKTIGKVTIGDSNTDVKLVSCVLYCG
jgi:hypothetical protein